jgi:galactokinase
VSAHGRAFGTPPTHAATAPGRVNLIGDHTDYNGGLALPIALDAHAAVVLGPGAPGRLEVVAADLDERHEGAFEASDIRADSTPAWFRYAAGAVLLGAGELGRDPESVGLGITLASSVPVGSGLSSSAAIEVATLTAIESFFGRTFEPRTKAMLCQRTEHEFARTPSGLLDPLASIMGATDTGVLIRFDSLSCTPVPIPAGVRFAILDSGEGHSNADGRYARIRAACEGAARALGVAMLSESSLREFTKRADSLAPEQRGAAAHVLSENERVRGFVRALGEGRLEQAGQLMNESHRSMSEQLGVSTPGIDRLQAAAAGVAGVLGCRLTGGGFGGFLVAMLDAGTSEAALKQIRQTASDVLGHPASVRLIRPGAGARPIEW